MIMTNQEFIQAIAKSVQKYAADYGIKVHSPIIAQAILESGFGKSKLSAIYHNYFGMKCGSKWTGKAVNLSTKEEYKVGTYTSIKSDFRVYDSMDEGIKGYFEFIQLERYKNLKGITDPEKYLQTIKSDGYATSSKYVENNMNVIKKYNLTQYDQKKVDNMKNTSDKVIAVAKAEDGYLEKKSNKDLDSKTKNAGSKNYTKYGKWFGLNPAYWCAMFISWCFYTAYGKEKGKSLLCGGFSAACETIRSNFKKKGKYKDKSVKPKAGWIVFFSGTRHAGANHIGLVTKVDSKGFYTMEGNTSSDKGVVDNGGSVNEKYYKFNYSKILGFGAVEYDESKSKKTVTEIAKEVIAGKWGTGTSRKQKLAAAGYDYAAVQKKVNELLK